MHFDSSVDPNQLYCSTGEACRTLGIDRNQLRGAMVRKDLSYDRVAGHTLIYRASLEAYVARLAKAGQTVNPYAKPVEASNARHPNT